MSTPFTSATSLSISSAMALAPPLGRNGAMFQAITSPMNSTCEAGNSTKVSPCVWPGPVW